ncbi:(2Fe-2S)-binding protein [Pelagibius sp. 7325]|uniref:(2Fe-2S)-binding protein n=1 Tax=Pelagibius sp. 7325 TaxID=3131994 RepID=UPI0030EC6752
MSVVIDGETVAASDGEMLAAVLLRTPPFYARRTPVSDSPRAPYCLMGVCFDCLATVDGIASVQTCLTPVRDGMRVERQAGLRELTK